jgi:putative FmdB family regulatory protein
LINVPIYEYEHDGDGCALGKIFEQRQAMNDAPLEQCPACGRPVRRLISRPNVKSAKSDSELRDLGFTKLVRRDKGVYENVTARKGEAKVVKRRGKD